MLGLWYEDFARKMEVAVLGCLYYQTRKFIMIQGWFRRCLSIQIGPGVQNSAPNIEIDDLCEQQQKRKVFYTQVRLYVYMYIHYICISIYYISIYLYLSLSIYIQIGRQVDRQTDRQIDRQIDRSIDRSIDRQIHRQIDRQIDRLIDRWIAMRIAHRVPRSQWVPPLFRCKSM